MATTKAGTTRTRTSKSTKTAAPVEVKVAGQVAEPKTTKTRAAAKAAPTAKATAAAPKRPVARKKVVVAERDVLPVAIAAEHGHAVPADRPRPTHEQIQLRAYQLYVNRGYTPGDPAADWLQAEFELLGEFENELVGA